MLQWSPVPGLRICVLDDGAWPFPARYFFANVPEARWRQEVDTDSAGKIPVGHNHGMVETEHALIVIDTGYGDDSHGGLTGHLLEEFQRTGHRREEVTWVVSTHAHGDHIKRHTVLEDGQRRPTFPRARYLLGQADWDWFSGPGRVPEFDEQVGTVHRSGMLTLLDGEVQLTPEVRLLPTPGHTPGHMSVLVESAGWTAIFLGDLCHHPLHFAHPEWVSSFDTHPTQTPSTRAAIFRLAVERDALLICPHAPAPGLGRLERTAEGYRWRPVAV